VDGADTELTRLREKRRDLYLKADDLSKEKKYTEQFAQNKQIFVRQVLRHGEKTLFQS